MNSDLTKHSVKGSNNDTNSTTLRASALIDAPTTVSASKYTLDYFKTAFTEVNVTDFRAHTSPALVGNTRKIADMSLPFNQLSTEIVGVNSKYQSACMAFATASIMTFYTKKLISPGWFTIAASGSYTYGEPMKDFKVNGVKNLHLDKLTIGTESENVATIKARIEDGQPVLVYCTGNGKYGEHWVVAYGFKNNCATKNDILVLDSANTTSLRYGRSIDGSIDLTLGSSMAYNKVSDANGNYNITEIRVVNKY